MCYICFSPFSGALTTSLGSKRSMLRPANPAVMRFTPHDRQFNSLMTIELKTVGSHLMPLQQNLYNGLSRPADYSIFTEMDSPACGQCSRIRSICILFFEGYMCTLTYSILAHVNKNRIRWNYNTVGLVN